MVLTALLKVVCRKLKYYCAAMIVGASVLCDGVC